MTNHTFTGNVSDLPEGLEELHIFTPPIPLHDRVVLEPLPVESVSTGGIIIPDTAKEKPQRGKVLYVGNGIKDEAMTVKVGDTVLYGKHAGQPIIIDGKDCLIMREADILMII